MRNVLQGSLRRLGLIIAVVLWPLYIMFGLISVYGGRFSDYSIFLSKIPFYAGEYVRYYYYRFFLQKCGTNTIFRYGSFVQYSDVEIGSRCLIGYYNAVGLVSMGDDVLCGGFINFTSGLRQHTFENQDQPINKQHGKRTRIIIASNIWIGNNCVICANVGERTVIGAGSVVINDIEGQGVYAGNPAKKLKSL